MHNNKSCRTKGISCSVTAVTTGITTSSSLEYAKPHSHLPDSSKIAALKIIDTTKNDAVVQHTVPPSNIVSSYLIGVADDVECHQTSLKNTVQRRRRKDAVTSNQDLTLADERSLLSLTIPAFLQEPWKFFDSGPGPNRVLILTTDDNLDFLCESVRWCGDGTFKASPKLWTQLYTIYGQKNGYTVPCVFALLPGLPKEPVASRLSFRPRPTEAARNTRIVNLITSYTRATADSFLRGIAFNIYVLISVNF